MYVSSTCMGVPYLWYLTIVQTTMDNNMWETAVNPEISHPALLNHQKLTLLDAKESKRWLFSFAF